MSNIVTSNTTESTNNKIIELQGMNQTLNTYLIDLKNKIDALMIDNMRLKEGNLHNNINVKDYNNNRNQYNQHNTNKKDMNNKN